MILKSIRIFLNKATYVWLGATVALTSLAACSDAGHFKSTALDLRSPDKMSATEIEKHSRDQSLLNDGHKTEEEEEGHHCNKSEVHQGKFCVKSPRFLHCLLCEKSSAELVVLAVYVSSKTKIDLEILAKTNVFGSLTVDQLIEFAMVGKTLNQVQMEDWKTKICHPMVKDHPGHSSTEYEEEFVDVDDLTNKSNDSYEYGASQKHSYPKKCVPPSLPSQGSVGGDSSQSLNPIPTVGGSNDSTTAPASPPPSKGGDVPPTT